MNMKKWFVGLMVLLTLVLASSTAMAVADYRVCSNCWAYRNGTTEYITDPNEIETSWDMHTDRIFTCSVCSVKTKLWSLHTGGGATCTTEGECDFCHASYKDESAHTGPYTYSYSKTSDTRHNVKATCKGCWRKAGTYSAKHEEAEAATCKTVAYCGLCRSRYGEKDPGNHVGTPTTTHVKTSETQHTAKITYADCGHTVDGASTYHTETTPATCTAAAYCADCKSSYGEADPDAHALESHDAQAPTCFHVGWDAYETCSRCDYTTYVELPALGHDYQAKIIPRTCEDDGYTLHTCTRCADRYADTIVPHCGHWYGEWTANGDGTQRAECLRGGCHHEKTVDCEIIELPALNISLCPVCGTASDGSRLALTNASVKIVSGRIPHGEALLRVGTLANGEKLLTVGYVYGGQLSKASCQVKITLPAGLLEGYALCLLSEDGTEAELTLDVQEDTVSFVIDYTDSLDTVKVLHLVPAV